MLEVQAVCHATIFFVFAFSLAVSAQTMAPFVPQNASPASVWAFDRNLLWGRTDAWEGSPDFFCRQSESHSNVIHPLSDGSPKYYAKGMVLGDGIGDAPDLILRRLARDGAAYNARPQVVGGGTSLGTLYWQAWGERCERRRYGFGQGVRGQWADGADLTRAAGAQIGTCAPAVPPRHDAGRQQRRPDRSARDRIGRSHHPANAYRDARGGSRFEDSCGTGYRCLRVKVIKGSPLTSADSGALLEPVDDGDIGMAQSREEAGLPAGISRDGPHYRPPQPVGL